MAETIYEFRNIHGHYEVFINGEFVLSADTLTEAIKEIEQMEVH